MVTLEENAAKHSYCFPDFLAKSMAKVDLRTQFEAGLVSMVLMMIGLIVTGIYLVIYVDLVLWYKIFLIINLIAGLVFFWSNLITTYQQYLNYMSVQEFTKC